MTLRATGHHADLRLFDRLRETGRCSWLLLSLVLLLMIYPLLDTSFTGRLILGLLNSAILVAGASAASGSRRTLMMAVAFALPALVLQWLTLVNRGEVIEWLLGVNMVLFYVFAISHVVTFVLQPGPVNGNKLHGGIAVYIMMGQLWTMVYLLIDHFSPGSFSYSTNSQHPWAELLFFSFTTLTTTGYGDTIPITGYARSAVMLEQLAGTFYVAILIARLAGLYQPGAGHGRSGDLH